MGALGSIDHDGGHLAALALKAEHVALMEVHDDHVGGQAGLGVLAGVSLREGSAPLGSTAQGYLAAEAGALTTAYPAGAGVDALALDIDNVYASHL